MSIPAFHWALSQRTDSSSQKAVLKCLAEWMIGDEAVECWPTVETIAFETDLNRETVMKATRALEKAGLIKKRRTCKGLLWQTRYTFVGYVPTDWIGSRRPTVRTIGNANVRKPEGTENRTSEKQDHEGTKNHTAEGTKNHTAEGTENQTRTWIDKDLDKERHGVVRAPSGAPQPPEMSDDEIAELLESIPPEKGERPPLKKGAHLSEKGDHISAAPKRKRASNVQKPESVSEQVWEDFSALRTKRRAPITETALKGIQREADKAGITLEAALSTCCERGWQGFKADWYKRGQIDEKNATKAACQVPSNDEWDNFDTAHYA